MNTTTDSNQISLHFDRYHYTFQYCCIKPYLLMHPVLLGALGQGCFFYGLKGVVINVLEVSWFVWFVEIHVVLSDDINGLGMSSFLLIYLALRMRF